MLKFKTMMPPMSVTDWIVVAAPERTGEYTYSKEALCHMAAKLSATYVSQPQPGDEGLATPSLASVLGVIIDADIKEPEGYVRVRIHWLGDARPTGYLIPKGAGTINAGLITNYRFEELQVSETSTFPAATHITKGEVDA